MLIVGGLILAFVYYRKRQEKISDKNFKRWRLIGGGLFAFGVSVEVLSVVYILITASREGAIYALF